MRAARRPSIPFSLTAADSGLPSMKALAMYRTSPSAPAS